MESLRRSTQICSAGVVRRANLGFATRFVSSVRRPCDANFGLRRVCVAKKNSGIAPMCSESEAAKRDLRELDLSFSELSYVV